MKWFAAVWVSGIMFVAAPLTHAGPLEDGYAADQRGDYAEAFRLWWPLAVHGDPVAQYNVGLMYNNGTGVPQDYAEAVHWYRLAANQGYAFAQGNLGIMYAKGEGVQQDYGMAFRLFRLAADQGNAPAQYNLGNMYANGYGVPQDYVQAHKWFNLAASRSSADENERRDEAVKGRDRVAAKMTPAQIADAQKLAREWRPKVEERRQTTPQ